MTAGLVRRSPLSGTTLPAGLREIPFLTQLDVRADASATELLPVEPNTVRVEDDRAILWLGPDEWLVVAPPDTATAVEADLRARLGTSMTALVDVAANRTTLELSGPHAREALESGCSIDLHPRAFGAGRCAQTMLARAQVILWQTDDAPTYRLLVRPSFAAYLAAWLIDALEAERR